MARRTRAGVEVRPLSVYVSYDLWRNLCGYCRDNGVSKTFVVETSVREYLRKVGANVDFSEKGRV